MIYFNDNLVLQQLTTVILCIFNGSQTAIQEGQSTITITVNQHESGELTKRDN